MQELKIKDILKICKGTLLCGKEDTICENFSKDTRTINKEDVYVGIRGENFDGNTLYKEAFENGASCCILQGIKIDEMEVQKYKDKSIILVEDTIKAIGQLANYKRSCYNIPVIAITGSVGKTSTKDVVASVMSQKYDVLKTQGNLNNHIGLPLTILGLKNHTALVVEMGMNALGEISTLTNIAEPTLAVITNIGTSHIGELGSRENILKAKLEILEGIKDNKVIVINNDNDLLHKWVEKTNEQCEKITYGIENNSMIMAKDIKLYETGSSYILENGEKKYKVEVPVGGMHFVYNSLCAISVGLHYDISIEDIIIGIKEFELTKRRMDIKKSKQNIIVINDSYNASYDSMKASIEYLASIKGNRKIAVLGDMFELGKFEKDLHEKVGEEVVKNNIDILVTIGNSSRYISNMAKKLGMNDKNIYHFVDKNEGIQNLKNIIKQEDIVLVKASNGMKFDVIAEKILEY